MLSALHARSRPNRASCRCSGVPPSSAAVAMRPAIEPISVAIPVATTTADARPEATLVPMCTMLRRSASAAVGSPSQCASFSTGTDSPVSDASPVDSDAASISRASAATTSPASSSTTSPGTISIAGTMREIPSRRTRAFGAVMRRSAAIDFSAWYSW